MTARNCNKVSFPNEKQALFYLDKLNRTANVKKKLTGAYLCPKCFNWHMTSQKDIKVVRLEEVITKRNLRIKELELIVEKRNKANRSLKNELSRRGNGKFNKKDLKSQLHFLKQENEALKLRIKNHEKK